MDGIDYKICRTQQRLYEYAARHGYEIEQFSNFFLSSDFCSRAFDVLYSRFQLETPVECMDFITPYTSKELCEKVPYSTVKKFYSAYGQETENYIAEDICINLHLNYDSQKVELKV